MGKCAAAMTAETIDNCVYPRGPPAVSNGGDKENDKENQGRLGRLPLR